MRPKLMLSLSVLLAAGLLTIRVYAQEGGNVEIQELNSHPELNLSEDKTLIMDSDAARTSKVAPSSREVNAQNAIRKQETQKTTSPNAGNEKTQEDPLSFNFLYYIIQRFKFSDIVDD